MKVRIEHHTGHVSEFSCDSCFDRKLIEGFLEKVDDGDNVIKIYDGRAKVYERRFKDEPEIWNDNPIIRKFGRKTFVIMSWFYD